MDKTRDKLIKDIVKKLNKKDVEAKVEVVTENGEEISRICLLSSNFNCRMNETIPSFDHGVKKDSAYKRIIDILPENWAEDKDLYKKIVKCLVKTIITGIEKENNNETTVNRYFALHSVKKIKKMLKKMEEREKETVTSSSEKQEVSEDKTETLTPVEKEATEITYILANLSIPETDRLYDVILQRNNVYIGMEDVSVTYRNEEIKENLSLTDAFKYISDKYEDFITSPQVIRLKEATVRSYYPVEFEMPCRAIIAEPDESMNKSIVNYSDLSKAERDFGAREISFSRPIEKIREEIDEFIEKETDKDNGFDK